MSGAQQQGKGGVAARSHSIGHISNHPQTVTSPCAPPGTVWLTRATYHTLAAQTSFQPLAPLTRNTKGGSRCMAMPPTHEARLRDRHSHLLTYSVDTCPSNMCPDCQ